jgi:dihydrofolate reductase
MKTLYYTATSLDGFIADSKNSLDWLLQFGMTDDYPDFIAAVGALAMGSTTYEWIVADLARSGTGQPQPWPYKQPTWVFTSRSLVRAPGADIRFVSGDVRPVHKQMASVAGDKNIWLVGGGELVGQFHDHGLVDELIVTVAPVTLGGGAPLLPRAIAMPPLRLLSSRTCAEGFVQSRYKIPRGGE